MPTPLPPQITMTGLAPGEEEIYFGDKLSRDISQRYYLNIRQKSLCISYHTLRDGTMALKTAQIFCQ